NIKKAKYSTSLDPRGFIPVFEYELYGHPIMWDQENLYVHFTGIWKVLGKTKADIVKIIDANPILESIIRKVRGGFLKIQGTWMPHQEAYDLAKKTCYKLRYELVPVFG
ncbi:transcription regulator HTH, apses-type DNA-binding domain-containing protein, partial [Lobosporangium transversale]